MAGAFLYGKRFYPCGVSSICDEGCDAGFLTKCSYDGRRNKGFIAKNGHDGVKYADDLYRRYI